MHAASAEAVQTQASSKTQDIKKLTQKNVIRKEHWLLLFHKLRNCHQVTNIKIVNLKFAWS